MNLLKQLTITLTHSSLISNIPNNLMPFVQQVAVGRRPALTVYGTDYKTKDGTGVRDYIHVVDLADGHIAAVNKISDPSVGCEVYNLGTKNGTSVLVMVAAFEKASGKKIPLFLWMRIYQSKYPYINLPAEPFLDIVSFIFSKKHNGLHAFIDSSSGLTVSYSKLYSLVQSMASGLHSMGVKQGDVILILLPNSVYFPVIFLGALSTGAIVTPMNPLSSLLEIKRQVLDSNASLVFSAFNRVDELVIELKRCRVIGVPEVSDVNSIFHKLISSDPNLAPRPKITQQDIAAILYSSGTTGRAKGVMLTHRNFISMVEIYVRLVTSLYDFPLSESVYLAVVPMFHIYGLVTLCYGLVIVGQYLCDYEKI
ncbi:hypothetical protein CASFOL_020335 [Castilleja foliolosa]|uniref:4-coumarate--CoA ligase n=1 Tax=Castilleja foliolosa TaxID=1961234 RepID=A0ABD3D0J6_9LAMI